LDKGVPTVNPRLDVVIPTRNGYGLLSSCITRLLEDAGGIDLRIIVVDDGSEDGTVERGGREFPSVEFVRNEGGRGFCRTVNLGAAGARDGLLAILNNDVEIMPGSLSLLVSAIEDAPPGVYSAMPRIVRNDGSDESLLRCRFERGLAVTGPGTGTPYPSGACSIFKVSTWRRLGGLDTRYAPMYWEDADLGLRAAALGLELVRVEEASVLHRHAATAGHGRGIMRLRERNRFILMDAHFRSRRFETAMWLPLHAAVSILRGRTEFLGGFADYLAWRRCRN